MRRFLLLLVTVAAFALPTRAQSGCPDFRATNYDPAATRNDGSCQYPATAAAPLLRATLPAEVHESSALQAAAGGVWTLNDSGNEPVLYRLDAEQGTITQRVRITNFPNVDWEELAANDQYLYVGDFGNNFGTRTDLRILCVRQATLNAPGNDTATAQAIGFRYPDQTDFTARTNNHNFDAEAFFYWHDSLHIFTKNWLDRTTTYYTVPAAPGNYVARRRAVFNTRGLITAADLNPAGTVAALLGYEPRTGATFAWLLFGFQQGSFLAGSARRIDLPSALAVGQVEGLCFVDAYRLLLSNEQLTTPLGTVPPRLYALDTSPWTAPATPTPTARPTKATGFQVYPNPITHGARLRSTVRLSEPVALTLFDERGRTVGKATLPAGQQEQVLPLVGAAPGVYFLKIQASSGTVVERLLLP